MNSLAKLLTTLIISAVSSFAMADTKSYFCLGSVQRDDGSKVEAALQLDLQDDGLATLSPMRNFSFFYNLVEQDSVTKQNRYESTSDKLSTLLIPKNFKSGSTFTFTEANGVNEKGEVILKSTSFTCKSIAKH